MSTVNELPICRWRTCHGFESTVGSALATTGNKDIGTTWTDFTYTERARRLYHLRYIWQKWKVTSIMLETWSNLNKLNCIMSKASLKPRWVQQTNATQTNAEECRRIHAVECSDLCKTSFLYPRSAECMSILKLSKVSWAFHGWISDKYVHSYKLLFAGEWSKFCWRCNV